jgi:hypothetical protein
VREHDPPLGSVRHPSDCGATSNWKVETCCCVLLRQRHGRVCNTTSTLTHRRHSESTSALALIACVSSSDWFRLTRYFRDHVVVRYAPNGEKLVYPVLVALSPRLHLDHSDVLWRATLKSELLPLTVTPDFCNL